MVQCQICGCADCPLRPFGGCGGKTAAGVALAPCPFAEPVRGPFVQPIAGGGPLCVVCHPDSPSVCSVASHRAVTPPGFARAFFEANP